jgi:TonB family protein
VRSSGRVVQIRTPDVLPCGVRDLRPGQPCVGVRGGLDKEIVRRVVRSHLKEIKFCYERELQHQPGLHGRVSVRFVIAPGGRVATVGVTDSTVANARVDRCIADAVARWQFPAAREGGVTFVTYPFVLQELGAE